MVAKTTNLTKSSAAAAAPSTTTTTAPATNATHEQNDDDVDNDCPLCLVPMSNADRLYPLHCPTVSCRFLFCGDCLQRLLDSAADGYTLASDGSHQVKVALQCPQCRGPYHHNGNSSSTLNSAAVASAAANAAAMSNALLIRPSSSNLSSSSGRSSPPSTASTSSATIVVTAVLKLRQAASIPLPGSKQYLNDSECSASILTNRHMFLSETTLKDLQDAVTIVQEYNDGIPDDKHNSTRNGLDTMTVPPLDWDAWRAFLDDFKSSVSPRNAGSNSFNADASHGNSGSFNTGSIKDAVLPRDPTLFMGLEDLLSLDEQEFITSMLVSGRAETVSQAAHLLQSIVEMTRQPRLKPSSSATTAATPQTTKPKQPHRPAIVTTTAAQREHQQKVRKRFPLPPHMPRAVLLPAYNPLDLSKALLKFVEVKTLPVATTTTTTTTASSNVAASAVATGDDTISGSDLSTDPPLQQQLPQQSQLVLASVRGAAGPVGLRKGDVVTHVMGETVSTWSEFTLAMQQQLLLVPAAAATETSASTSTLSNNGSNPNGSPGNLVQVTVNANDETAQLLHQRARDMKQQGVRFHG